MKKFSLLLFLLVRSSSALLVFLVFGSTLELPGFASAVGSDDDYDDLDDLDDSDFDDDDALLGDDEGGEDAVISSVGSDLEYDENQKLKSNILLYTDNPACTVELGLPMFFSKSDYSNYFEGYATLSGSDAEARVFPGKSAAATSPFCRAVCLARGTDRAVADAVMPTRKFDSAGPKAFEAWFRQECARVEVCFMNYASRERPLKTYWLDPQKEGGGRVHHMDIKYGEPNTKCFHTFLGHKFEAAVVGDDGEEEVIEQITIQHVTVKAFGESPPSDDPGQHSFDKEIELTLMEEWRRHNRITRTFSPLGFKKGKLPRDVFADMGAFYYNNRFNKVNEEWKNRGVFVNWWETDVYLLPLPWELRGIWQKRLLSLVEEWAGIPVEQTSMYGLREYTDGARLLTHVDRHTTHAVSLIVNIAQTNLTEPWPVEVQDHADRMHEVIMEPGEIVYYESAKALHGRNRPLPGGSYVNLFTHYRPIGDPDWFKKPNPEGTPEPLLEDVQGDCRLEKLGMTAMENGQLGIVEGVMCDDERLGSHISPTLFKATSGEDLISWWRMTDPNDENTVIYGAGGGRGSRSSSSGPTTEGGSNDEL